VVLVDMGADSNIPKRGSSVRDRMYSEILLNHLTTIYFIMLVRLCQFHPLNLFLMPTNDTNILS